MVSVSLAVRIGLQAIQTNRTTGPFPKQDQEFLKFLDDEFADQELDLHLVINSYGTHKHPKVKAWLQRHPRFVLHVPVASIRWNGGLES